MPPSGTKVGATSPMQKISSVSLLLRSVIAVVFSSVLLVTILGLIFVLVCAMMWCLMALLKIL